jgi:NADH-quinone oxidoreductase subunit A
MLAEYLNLYFYMVLSFIITVALLCVCGSFLPDFGYPEKLSVYECGFDPFEDTRATFDIHFYMTAILFIVFDLEFIYLFPWFTVPVSDIFRLYTYMGCMVVLLLGLVYELESDVLDWTKRTYLD